MQAQQINCGLCFNNWLLKCSQRSCSPVEVNWDLQVYISIVCAISRAKGHRVAMFFDWPGTTLLFLYSLNPFKNTQWV